MASQQRISDADRRTWRLINTGGLDLRRGGWRFGTRRVASEAVERIVASGRAVIRAGRCIPASTETASRSHPHPSPSQTGPRAAEPSPGLGRTLSRNQGEGGGPRS